MIGDFRDTIDSVRVFAALSAGIIATLVAQTSQRLEPDQAQITNRLLVEQVIPLRAAGNATAISLVPLPSVGPNTRTHSDTDVATNALGYLSLALAVGTAVISVLVKQWLQLYLAPASGSKQDRALTRHPLRQSLEMETARGCGHSTRSRPLLIRSLCNRNTRFCVCSRPICRIYGHRRYNRRTRHLSCKFATVFLTAFAVNSPYRIPILYRPIHTVLRLFEKGWFAIRRVLGMGRQRTAFRPSAETPSLRPTQISPIQHGEKERMEVACGAIAWLNSASTSGAVQQLVAEMVVRLGPPPPHWEAWVRRHGDSLKTLFTPALVNTVWTCITSSRTHMDPICDYPTCSAILDTLRNIHAVDPILVNYQDGLRYAFQKAEETGSSSYMEYLIRERRIDVAEMGGGVGSKVSQRQNEPN
ncbi:hypothetical protein PQX77_017356 [Marasmius sp. AFHP31]|nr:hypothetical protein PQX77_017356 [Marasmius sp. AFHP31]